MKLKRVIKYVVELSIIWFAYLTFSIHFYSKNYSNQKSNVAIVLGAASHNGKVAPVFRERLNQAIFLYKTGKVDQIIITGGFGKNEIVSDSKAGKNYVESKCVPKKNIFIEEESTITQTNLINAKVIMDEQNWDSALLVSDPFHMKRAMALSSKIGINCQPSPTQTSMYKSRKHKIRSLIYESFFFTIELVLGHI